MLNKVSSLNRNLVIFDPPCLIFWDLQDTSFDLKSNTGKQWRRRWWKWGWRRGRQRGRWWRRGWGWWWRRRLLLAGHSFVQSDKLKIFMQFIINFEFDHENVKKCILNSESIKCQIFVCLLFIVLQFLNTTITTAEWKWTARSWDIVLKSFNL